MLEEGGVVIPLADTIRALRAELNRAMVDGKDEEIRFELSEAVELDLQVQISYQGGAEAGIKFGVVSIGAKGEASTARTHTIKLKLMPELRSGGRVRVKDERGE
jgi:hypothetical protein